MTEELGGGNRLLVVDDEPQMLAIIDYILTKAGFETRTAADIETAAGLVRDEAFDCVILDIMVNDASGLTLCQRIRERTGLPVVFLSALGGAEERVAGFEVGADDYIVKPFNSRELVLRIRAVLARYQGRDPEETIENGPVRLLLRSQAVLVGRRRVKVSEYEMRFLVTLARRLGQPVGWRDLVSTVWRTGAPETGKEMLKTLVHRLRGKLGPVGCSLIVAVRGQGYTMPEMTVTQVSPNVIGL